LKFSKDDSNLKFVPLSFPLKNKIFICGAGGKSSLARSIQEKHGNVHIELDACKFLPNWKERTVEEFRDFTVEKIKDSQGRWVIEGNYTEKLGNLILKDSKLIIWLDLSWEVVFWRIFLRSIRRCFTKQTVCGGNHETWRQFFSRDSICWYYISRRFRILKGHREFLQLVPLEIPILRISNARQLRSFYKIHELNLIRENQLSN
tara:strand:- start:310 stop:921 length:612 start_codon:yes stop_codon:yes gene_type:complete